MCYNVYMYLPEDDAILLSLINMKLRDCGLGFEEFCAEEEADASLIADRLGKFGYKYDESENAFKSV